MHILSIEEILGVQYVVEKKGMRRANLKYPTNRTPELVILYLSF
jgi:hypothetical protein